MKTNYLFKKLSLLLSFILLTSYTAISCDYTISLHDSYGDGWNGGKVTVMVNGNIIINELTILTGAGPLDSTFSVSTGDIISTTYVAGSYPSENSYEIKDFFGVVVASQGASGVPGDISNLIGLCPYNLDAGIFEVFTSSSNAGSQSVKAVIMNYGVNTLTTADVNWSVDGVTQTLYSYSGSLAMGSIDTVTIGSFTFVPGVQNIMAYISNPNNGIDENANNDTAVYSDYFLGAHAFPLTEDFEGASYLFGNNFNNNVDFTDETTLFHSGSKSVMNAYGASNNNSFHELGLIDLSTSINPQIMFWHIAKTEGNYDKCYIEVSTDGGTTYVALDDSLYAGTSANYAVKGYFHEDSYTVWGTSSTAPDNSMWKKEVFDLTPFKQADVRFRFRLQSDGSVQRAGWYIDDVSILEQPINEIGVSMILGTFGGFTATVNDTVTIIVENHGAAAQTNVPVKYQLDNGTVVSEVIPTLGIGAVDTFVFATTFDATASGDHILRSYTDLSNEEDHSNDTAYLAFNTAPQNEVGVLSFIGNYGGYNTTSTDTITVKVKNYGTVDQVNIPIRYMFNNGSVVLDTITSLAANSIDTFVFAQTFDGTIGGNNMITAYTELSNDENNANDTAYKSFVTAAQNDLGVITLISPVSSICGNASTNVKVIVKNFGLMVQNNVPVSVVITDASGTPVTLTGTTASIASLATDTVDMGSVSTVNTGIYNVMAYTSLSADTVFNDNDTLNTTFEIASVFAVSHVEDFEDGAVNWAGVGMYVGTGHGRSGKGMYKNFYSYSNTGSAMMKNKISSITANSRFVFDYQIKDYGSAGGATTLAGDKFYFMLSTDCGTTFDTIATIDATTHTTTLDWTHKMIDLTSYVGQEVVIMFSGTWDAGDYYFNMDNVGIANPPAAIDLGVDTTICLNSSYALDATSGAGSYYMWTANNDTLAFTGAILNVDTAATYAVEVMAPAGTVYDTIVITTHAVTMVSFTSLDTVYCSTVDPITLVATPTGGVFTGNGVTGDSFDPATSGLGEQIITYEFTDANTCVSTTFDTTFINEGPMVVMTADMDICEGDSVTLFAAPIVATPGVFFSMYIEGSGNNKALEVYNGTNATINLDEYSIMTNYNGNPWSGQYHFPAGATLDAGDVFVISNVAADDAMLAVADDSLAYNEGGYVVGFNGDDVRALFHNTTATDSVMVDIIGLYDLTDPGSGWDVAGVASATKDHSLIRKPSVVGGSTDWNSIAGTDSMNSQYLVYSKNTFAGLGSHTVTPPAVNMDTYLWSTGETTSSIVVKPTATTTYTVTVANTLCSDEGTVIVTVNAMPVVDLGPDQTVKHIMGSVNLDAGNVGATYLWSTGETSQIVTFNNSNLVIGDTTIFVTVDNNGCVASDTIILTVIDDVSIDDMLNNVNVSIYPNPNNGQFNMTIEGMTGEFNMQIVSINGKVVYNEQMNSTSAQNTSIDVSELAAGVYYIKLMNNNGVKTEKLIIK